jgi:hypothetical protein
MNPILSSLFFVLTFHSRSSRFGVLRQVRQAVPPIHFMARRVCCCLMIRCAQVVTAIHAFPTTVTVTVVTNNPKALERVVATWGVDVRVAAARQLNHPHDLAWEHQHVIEEAFKTGTYLDSYLPSMFGH